jgi:hypothetical protein
MVLHHIIWATSSHTIIWCSLWQKSPRPRSGQPPIDASLMGKPTICVGRTCGTRPRGRRGRVFVLVGKFDTGRKNRVWVFFLIVLASLSSARFDYERIND